MELKVGFSKPKAKWKILSKMICWVQGWDKASHTYLVLWDDASQQEIVFQAAFPKVSLMTKRDFLEDNEVYTENARISSSAAARSMVAISVADR